MKFRWGTVTAVNPLRVRLDGDTVALPFTPDSLATVMFGDRVRCEIDARRVIVHGRAGGSGPIGEHIAGEWSAASLPSGCVLPDGTVHLIADYPKLAAHYAAVYGSANFHGGNGTTTFAVPDTRERVYVNQGGSDIFAAIGGKTGAKTHTHPLSDAGWALIRVFSGAPQVLARFISGVPSWTAERSVTSTAAVTSESSTNATPLRGSTDSASTVQPSFVCRYVIRAA